MSKDVTAYLKHILEECEFILRAVENVNSKDVFLQDELLKRAVTRSLEIIGEASKKIPADYKALNSAVKWKNMAGMRDRLIHDYMGIDYAIVWDVIKNIIPELKNQILGLLNK